MDCGDRSVLHRPLLLRVHDPERLDVRVNKISRQSLKNDEITRMRMKDAIGTVIMEEVYGNQYAEWAWGPHDFHYNRLRGMTGYRNPDDPRVIF